MTFGVTTRGIPGVEDLLDLDPKVNAIASQTVNEVAREMRTQSARQILAQVNLPASYVSPRNQRLEVVKSATPADPEAIIRAQGRASSLTRFLIGTRQSGAGLAVNIRGSGVKRFRRAFLFRGRRVGATTDTGPANQLFAFRVARGQRLQRSSAAREIDRGLYLLFGPSVSQIALSEDNTGVFRELEEPAAQRLERRFLARLRREGF